MSVVNFAYQPFQENVGILGMQGSGKTTLARDILAAMPRVKRFIWSPQWPMDRYGEFGAAAPDLSKLPRSGAHVFTGEFSAQNFDRVCAWAMRQTNTVMVFDDVHEYVKKQKIPDPFARLINSGRNRGVCSIFLTPSPNIVHNTVLQSCKHIFAFKMGIESQIKWLALNYYGQDAYVLLPRPLRRETPTIGDQWDVLPDHSYLYRKHTDTQNTLHVPGGAEPEPPATDISDTGEADVREPPKPEEANAENTQA